MSHGSWLGGGTDDELDEDVDGELEALELLTPPVHATPFMVNAVGTGLLLLVHVPLAVAKPKHVADVYAVSGPVEPIVGAWRDAIGRLASRSCC